MHNTTAPRTPTGAELLAVADAAGAYSSGVIRFARELGTTTHARGIVTVGEASLVGMIAQAYTAGCRDTVAEAELDDADRARAERDQALAYVDRVRSAVEGARARAGEEFERVAVVELPSVEPTLERAHDETSGAPAEGEVYAYARTHGRLALFDMVDGDNALELDVEAARALVPLLAFLVRAYDDAEAARRTSLVAEVASAAHVRVCGGAADGVCETCLAHAEATVEALAERGAA
jgi:hypothetical protein